LELSTTGLRAIFSAAVALCAISILSGCRSVPRTRVDATLTALPPATRDQMQIYLVGSPLDGFELGGLPDIERHLRQIGFEHTDAITWTTPALLARRVAVDRQANPQSRVVLVGWSLGCFQILEAASRLEQKKIEVDSVICLDGNPWIKLQGIRDHYPTTSDRVLCIYPPHRRLPDGLARTRQVNVSAPHHFAVPLNEKTVETILTELATVATSDSQRLPQAPVAEQASVGDSSRAPWYVREALPARRVISAAHWATDTDASVVR
jgi:pimeloyl-ACP methyl ester carboxylesterase